MYKIKSIKSKKLISGMLLQTDHSGELDLHKISSVSKVNGFIYIHLEDGSVIRTYKSNRVEVLEKLDPEICEFVTEFLDIENHPLDQDITPHEAMEILKASFAKANELLKSR